MHHLSRGVFLLRVCRWDYLPPELRAIKDRWLGASSEEVTLSEPSNIIDCAVGINADPPAHGCRQNKHLQVSKVRLFHADATVNTLKDNATHPLHAISYYRSSCTLHTSRSSFLSPRSHTSIHQANARLPMELVMTSSLTLSPSRSIADISSRTSSFGRQCSPHPRKRADGVTAMSRKQWRDKECKGRDAIRNCKDRGAAALLGRGRQHHQVK